MATARTRTTPPASAPKVPAVRPVALPELVEVAADEVGPGEHREGELYADVDFGGAELEFTSFSSCAFRRATLSEARLRGTHFVDTRLAELDCPSFAAPRSVWRNVELDTSRIGSAELYDANWRSVQVTGSKLGFVNARASTWQDVIFTDCTIQELDLGAASLTRVAFQRCRIETLDLTGATCADLDLRTVTLQGIRGLDGMAGSWVTEQQLSELAPLLAEQLRIRVG